LLLRAIREVHEYQADSISKGQGAGSTEYIRLMLETSMPGIVPALSTGFNKPLTLKRLTMITKEKSVKMSVLKYLLAIPAVLTLVFVFSTSSCSNDPRVVDATDSSAYPPPPPPPPPAPPAPDSASLKVYFEVEKMPVFTYKGMGSIEGFRAYVMDNVKYPEEAMTKGIQGKVYISFVVDANGSMTNVKVMRGVNKLLDEEAVRAVKTSPKWIPGEEKGAKVAVGFTIPVTFKLS